MQHLFSLALVIFSVFYVTVLIKNHPRPDEFFSAVVARKTWSRRSMKFLVIILVVLLAMFFFGFFAPKYNLGLIEFISFVILCGGLLLVGLFPSIDKKSSTHFVSGMLVVVLFLIFVGVIILKVWQGLSNVSQILLGANLAIIAILMIIGFIGAFAKKNIFIKKHLLLLQTIYIAAIAMAMILLTYT